jgi:Raf kinase inhibitor-like YbhB/YbcL family protein
MKIALAHACATLLLLSSAGVALAGEQGTRQSISVVSSAFEDGEMIPAEFTADGKNVSPPLSWSDLPEGTQEIALILEDSDALTPQPFVHWLMYKIPGTATGLPSAVPAGVTVNIPGLLGAIQGVTGFGTLRPEGSPRVAPGYRGPAPPPGNPHEYRFKIYALSDPVEAADGLDKASLLEAMEGKVIGEGEIVGLYERQVN